MGGPFPVGFIRERTHPRQIEPLLTGEQQAEQQGGADREQMEHDGGAYRRIVRCAEEGGGGKAKGCVESADGAGCRDGDPNHQQRDDEEGAGERDVKVEGLRRAPDAGRNRQPERERERQRHGEPPGLTDGAEADGELLAHLREQTRELRRQQRLESLEALREPHGVARQQKQHHERGNGAGRRREAGPLHRLEGDGTGVDGGRGEDEDVERQQRYHRHHVEHALEDDRGKGAGRAHLLLPRQEVGPDDLARTRRQHGAGGEPDGGGAERTPEARPAERLEQVLPAPGTDREVHEHGAQRERQPAEIGVHDLTSDTTQVYVVEEQDQERGAQRQNDDCSQMRSHERLMKTFLLYLSSGLAGQGRHMLLL